jgi:hypothetical protein
MLETIIFRHILRDDRLAATAADILATYETYAAAGEQLEVAITDHLIEDGLSDFAAELVAACLQHTDFNRLIDLLDQAE